MILILELFSFLHLHTFQSSSLVCFLSCNLSSIYRHFMGAGVGMSIYMLYTCINLFVTYECNSIRIWLLEGKWGIFIINFSDFFFSFYNVDLVMDPAYIDWPCFLWVHHYCNRCICMGLKLHLGRMNMGKNCFFLVVRYANVLYL